MNGADAQTMADPGHEEGDQRNDRAEPVAQVYVWIAAVLTFGLVTVLGWIIHSGEPPGGSVLIGGLVALVAVCSRAPASLTQLIQASGVSAIGGTIAMALFHLLEDSAWSVWVKTPAMIVAGLLGILFIWLFFWYLGISGLSAEDLGT